MPELRVEGLGLRHDAAGLAVSEKDPEAMLRMIDKEDFSTVLQAMKSAQESHEALQALFASRH